MHSRLIVLICICICTAPTALGHHDMDLQPALHVDVRGEIVKASWDGAHVVYILKSGSDARAHQTWTVMGASPKTLRRRGILKNPLRIGDTVSVRGRIDSKTNFVIPDYLTTETGERLALGYDSRAK